MVKHNKNNSLRLLTAFSFVTAAVSALLIVVPNVKAAACQAPPTDLGSDTLTIEVKQAATYTVWTRMKAPDTAHNSINLQIDGTNCYNVGGGSFVATSWAGGSGNWIKYQNGSTANAISLQLSAGNHSFKYIGTQAGVEIDRIILASDASCTPTGTGDNCQSGDSTPPTVNLSLPTANQTVSGGDVKFQATAADNSGTVANVQFLVNGSVVGTDTSSPYEFSWNSASVSNGSYSVAARATDGNNNTATSNPVTVKVSNSAACSAAPSVPSGLKISSRSSTSASLTWSASTTGAGCTIQGYRVYRNGTQVGTPTTASYTDNGLTPGAAYSYTVAAVDTSSHVSAQSAAVSTSTTADTTPPSVPGGLHSTLVTANGASLAWNASTDSGGIKEYVILRNGNQAGTSVTTDFTAAGLVAGTSYSFTVVARDQAGNQSAASSALSVKTLTGSSAGSGDLNNDHKVDFTDLRVLLTNWNRSGVSVSQGDLNGDGKVSFNDLVALLKNWNKPV